MPCPLTKEQVLRQVSYDPVSGIFAYLNDRYVTRRFHFQRAVEPKPRLVQKVGDRADKAYGDSFIGVYLQVGWHEGQQDGQTVRKPTMAVLSATGLAILICDGYWPDAVLFEDSDWRNCKRSNLKPITQSEQGRLAGLAAHPIARQLPRNVYGTSSGRFIGRRGRNKTEQFDTPEEARQSVEEENWV